MLNEFYAARPPRHPLGSSPKSIRRICFSREDWARIKEAAEIADVTRSVLIGVAARCLADRLIEGKRMLNAGQVELWEDTFNFAIGKKQCDDYYHGDDGKKNSTGK